MSPAIFRDESTIVSFQSPNLRELDTIDSSAAIAEAAFDLQEFNIRMANSQGRREAATLLLKKMYSWRGYAVEAPPEDEPNLITLTADTGGKTVGTMTLCLDSDEAGLPADETFRQELDMLRAQSRRLCEPSRLAIDRDTPKRVFAALMHISYIYAHKMHHFTDYVIEVNPRHATFYKRMLGFQDFGAQRICARVDAPAVLLRLECSFMAEQIRLYGGLFENAIQERSFYPYAFSSKDEAGIHHRLMTGQS